MTPAGGGHAGGGGAGEETPFVGPESGNQPDSAVETIAAERWPESARRMHLEGWWLADLCGLDRKGIGGAERFEIVVQLLDPHNRRRRTVHVLAGGDPPTVPSIVDVWPTANFMEREAYDMFGIVFAGHPNLTRILMPDEWEGHPLRKDYGVGKVPVQFREQPFLQITGPGQGTNTEEAGLEVDRLGQPSTGRPR